MRFVFQVTLGAFSTGTCLAWTSPSMPHIDQAQCGDSCDVMGISKHQAEWIGPVFAIGTASMGPVVGPMINRLGRKKAMITLAFPIIAGWILIITSPYTNSFSALVVARLLSGELMMVVLTCQLPFMIVKSPSQTASNYPLNPQPFNSRVGCWSFLIHRSYLHCRNQPNPYPWRPADHGPAPIQFRGCSRRCSGHQQRRPLECDLRHLLGHSR